MAITIQNSILKKNKRGFFLTMIAILLLSLFIVYFQISIIRQSKPALIANTARVNSITSFVNDLERFYLPSLATVSLSSSLQAMNSFLSGGNAYIRSVNQSTIFYQLMTNGTIYPFNSTKYSNESLNVLLPQFTKLISNELNIPLIINYTPYKFSLSQESPWTVTVNMAFLYSINTSEVSFTNRTIQIKASVPIIGLQDPYSLINTRGNYSPNITQTNVSNWNITKFNQHILSQQFANNPIAPSYLNRLANDSSASENGIEFFVIPAMYGLNVTAFNYSFVDYQFWTKPWNCSSFENYLYTIENISNTSQNGNFRVDDAHLSKYVSLDERLNSATLVCYN